MKKNIQLLLTLLIIIMVRGGSYAQISDGLVVGSGDMLRSQASVSNTLNAYSEDYNDAPVTDMLINEGIVLNDSYQVNRNSTIQDTSLIEEQLLSSFIINANVYDSVSAQNDSSSVPIMAGLSAIPPSLIRLIESSEKKGFTIADF